nr:right-handed parallel beta-helix repeat-containing protein [uncultured Sphingomonas sp.]
MAYAAPAAAQATRTWVSGVGDDANPCSRTAPCKTFAGAISKTAAGGEINCIDQGAYGAVTITKAIALQCVGVTAGVLHSSTNGIVINAAATDNIFIKGLDINGSPPTSPGLNGIRFLAGASLTVENTVIRGSNGAAPNGFGILFAPSGASKLVVTNSSISNNGTVSSGGGILVQPTGAGGSAIVTLQGVSLNNNPSGGFKIDTTGNTSAAGVKATISDSDITGNGGGVAVVVPGGASAAALMIVDSNVSNNGAGIIGNGVAATVRVSGTAITNNGTGLVVAGGSFVMTFGDNLLQGNTTNGAFAASTIPKT